MSSDNAGSQNNMSNPVWPSVQTAASSEVAGIKPLWMNLRPADLQFFAAQQWWMLNFVASVADVLS
jgi:hypothetical protein